MSTNLHTRTSRGACEVINFGVCPITTVNYSAAIDVLQRRFGNKTVVQRAYIKDLLNVKPVFNANDMDKLRKLFDTIESNYRGLMIFTYFILIMPYDNYKTYVTLNWFFYI